MLTITWPNRISIARIVLVGPFVIVLLHLRDWGDRARWAALAIFVVMAISDALDGYLARRLHQESAVGRFLDPLADKILVLCSVVLLAHEGTHVPGAMLPSWVAVISVGKDFIVIAGFMIIYFATSQIYIDPRWTGKMCTSVQLLMVILILLYPDLPGALTWLPALLWWAASIMAGVTVVDYFQRARHFIARHELATAHPATRSSGPDAP